MTKKILISITILFSIYVQGTGQSSYLDIVGTRDNLFSNTLEEQRIFWVQLPENFNPESKQKYPVIYVLDGEVHLKAVYTVLSYYWGGYIPK
jgi:predicted alpha/beta superfamily hydrolase